VNGLTTETEKGKVHPNWLRFMYVVNVFYALGIGLGLLLVPNTMMSLFGYSVSELVWSSYGPSYMVALGLLCILALRSPVKFSLLLVVQAITKIVWILAIAVPGLVAGTLPTFGLTLCALFVPVIIGDVIAVPWRQIIEK
jgi:hypothetical protein